MTVERIVAGPDRTPAVVWATAEISALSKYIGHCHVKGMGAVCRGSQCTWAP